MSVRCPSSIKNSSVQPKPQDSNLHLMTVEMLCSRVCRSTSGAEACMSFTARKDASCGLTLRMPEILLSALTTLAVLTACCAFWTTLMPDCGPATWQSPMDQRQALLRSGATHHPMGSSRICISSKKQDPQAEQGQERRGERHSIQLLFDFGDCKIWTGKQQLLKGKQIQTEAMDQESKPLGQLPGKLRCWCCTGGLRRRWHPATRYIAVSSLYAAATPNACIVSNGPLLLA